ncbi:MAG: DUF3467 domain-containing protein [Pyrinomonadaceae bacterium]
MDKITAKAEEGQALGSASAEVTIPVENYLPDDVPTYYSDGTLILHSANEFIISFMQTEFPLASSREELQELTSIRRKCVARVIVSPAQFQAIAKVSQEQMDKYLASHKKPEDEQ